MSANQIDSISVPMVTNIGGNLFLQSSEVLNCAPLRNMYINGYIGGEFYCEGAAVPTSSRAVTSATSRTGSAALVTSTTHTSTSSSGGLSASAKGGIIAGAVVAAILVVSIAAFIVLQRRRKLVTSPTTASKHPKLSELPQGRHYERSELLATPNQVSELHGDRSYRPTPSIENNFVTTVPGWTQPYPGAGPNTAHEAGMSGSSELQ
jgi:hypothetical protein